MFFERTPSAIFRCGKVGGLSTVYFGENFYEIIENSKTYFTKIAVFRNWTTGVVFGG